MQRLVVLILLSSFPVLAVPFIQGTPLPGGRIGEPYNATIDIFSSDPATLSVTLVGGNLPAGISLSASGVLSGTPTVAGDFNFSIRASDSTGSSTDSKLLRIANTQLLPSSDIFVTAFLGIAVNFQVEVSGATPPIFVTRESGALPPGLSLSSSGRITGTPTALGTYNFRLIVSDSSGRQTSFGQTFRVIDSPIRITSLAPPRAVVGLPYSFQLTASGGNTDSQPTFYRILSGDIPPGLTWNNEGRISGTPTTAGAYTARWTAADFSGTSPETPLTITVALTNFTLSGTPPSGRVSQPYSFSFTANNGSAPFTYSLLSGQLPPGLSLNASTGLLSGTPTARGSFTATLRARDAAGNQADLAITILIDAPPLLLNTTTLPPGRLGVAYAARLEASGTPPFTFVIESGTLPRGLSLSGAGEFSGTPQASGAFPFTVRLQDSSGATTRANLRLEIQASPLSFAAPALPKAYANLDYLARLSAQGGAGAVTFSARNALPAGLTLSSDGRLSGRPQQAGSYQLQFRAIDAAQQIADTLATLVVEPTPTSLTILESSLPSFSYGLNPGFRFQAAAGTAPYQWQITQGSLPAGLRLDPSTGQILGRPLVWGPYSATIRVTDASGNTALWPLASNVQTPLRPPTATAGTPWSYNFAADFPPGTIFAPDAAIPGSIPAGLTLSREGVLSGTPSTSGLYTFGLLLLSASGEYASAAVFLPVEPMALPSIPGASVGLPYQATLDNEPNANVTLASGSLPPGLALTSNARLEGTPTTAGSYSFTTRPAPARPGAIPRFHLLHVLPAGTPQLSALANAANYDTSAVASLTLVTAFGQGIGPANLAPLTLDENQKLTRELASTRLLFDGLPAPLLYASSSQSSAVTPDFAATPFVQVTAEHNGLQSVPLLRGTTARQVAAFTQDASGSGPAAALNQDGSLNTAQRPARRNEIVVLFLTGCGNTSPASTPGDIATAALPLSQRATLRVGGVPAEVLYAGTAPGLLIGVCQINARLASNTPTGLQVLSVQVGPEISSSTAAIFVE